MCVQPSRVIFCHGKVYASNAYGGGITEFTVDSNYEVVASRVVVTTPEPFPTSSSRTQWSILGLACDPRDNDEDFRLYFSHSLLYSQLGQRPTEAAPYLGSVRFLHSSALADSQSHTVPRGRRCRRV